MSAKRSEPEKVDTYLRALKHPLKDVAEELRATILKASPAVGEEIKWNAPAFFYTGEMAEFDAKSHARHLVVFNLFQRDCVRLVFLRGATLDDASGLLVGDSKDGRRLALFASMDEARSKKTALERVIQRWVNGLMREPGGG